MVKPVVLALVAQHPKTRAISVLSLTTEYTFSVVPKARGQRIGPTIEVRANDLRTNSAVQLPVDSLTVVYGENGEGNPGPVVTDGWPPYRGLEQKGYIHERRSQRVARARGEDPGALLPGVHRIASLAKRWLLGTHEGAVDAAHLPSYLNEFVFRFNRRRSRSRGLLFYRILELAVAHDPVRYQDLTRKKSPKAVRPAPPKKRGHPPSLDRPRQNRPWRRGDSG